MGGMNKCHFPSLNLQYGNPTMHCTRTALHEIKTGWMQSIAHGACSLSPTIVVHGMLERACLSTCTQTIWREEGN